MRPLGDFTIAPDHPALPGHFPGCPIVPGVVLLDRAAILIAEAEPARALAGFPAVRFTRPVRPGETVTVSYDAGRFALHAGTEPVLSGTVGFR